ncbi:MAG: proline--tRNA ligase [Planctomycetota bacterium]|nr:proline--tRNA ligase [Planctomycetota bacterium]MDI6787088.1 proline--tRNA ligase [Planctomycetota bacterium]
MKWTNSFIPTLKEDPAEAESLSHKLMIRAGLIRKLSAGTYNYLPLGTRVLNKVINIVREEMDGSGSLEVLLPALHPPEPWEQTGRLKDFGDIIFKIKDRSGKLNLLGPTHEEIITLLVSNEISSYRQLPVILYQIQTKFRDEIRPRFGVIRSKEFIMMDAYSFDIDEEGLEKSYRKMYKAYCRIFDRCGLSYHIIEADPGLMGGKGSHEFTCPSPAGEDLFIKCGNCNYSANPNFAPINEFGDKSSETPNSSLKPLKDILTPDKSSIEAVSKFLNVQPTEMVKTMVCRTPTGQIAVLLRGDHELNFAKLARLVSAPVVELSDEKTIEKVTGGAMGFSGPVGLSARGGPTGNIKIIADYSVLEMKNFVTGANKKDMHFLNVNINRDFKIDRSADVRIITEQDPCPSCGKRMLKIMTGIELGHIFKLGTKYSEALNACFLDEKGKRLPMIMGCYGIGVNRIIASAIENSYDENGIIWTNSIAPYQVIIISINPADKRIREVSEKLYQDLRANSIEVLWDDRDTSPGVKFKDADLLGIPLIVTVGKGLKDKVGGKVDIKYRSSGKKESIGVDKVLEHISSRVQGV